MCRTEIHTGTDTGKESDSPAEAELSDTPRDDSDSGGVNVHPSSMLTPLTPQLGEQGENAASSALHRSKHSRPQKTFHSSQMCCEDTDCEDDSNPEGMIQCAGPACGAFVRILLIAMLH